MPASPVGDQIRRKTPAGRWGTDTDLVGPVVFLASAASDFVTGSVLPSTAATSLRTAFENREPPDRPIEGLTCLI